MPSNEPGARDDAYDFSHRIRVRFSETDAMGIVHHSRYLPYFEETRVEYLRELDHPYDEMRAQGIDMAVIEAGVRYKVPLRFDDLVDVHVRMGEVARASFRMDYLLRVGDQVVATGFTRHACISPDGRPTRMPAWLRELCLRPADGS